MGRSIAVRNARKTLGKKLKGNASKRKRLLAV